jgi:hypothetical protein
LRHQYRTAGWPRCCMTNINASDFGEMRH